jgi:peroxiredoxin
MKRIYAAALVAAAAACALPAFAALEQGAKAPEITAKGMLDGKEFTFRLSDAQKKGPVVIYFFPAAFTAGCTAETKAFADAADQFKAAGATLVGLTAGAMDPDTKKYVSAKDNLPLLQKFSEEDCRNKFPIAAVDLDTVKAYNVVLPAKPDWSDRTSYVIGKDGKIVLAYTDMKPNDHITKTLEAVKGLKK